MHSHNKSSKPFGKRFRISSHDKDKTADGPIARKKIYDDSKKRRNKIEQMNRTGLRSMLNVFGIGRDRS